MKAIAALFFITAGSVITATPAVAQGRMIPAAGVTMDELIAHLGRTGLISQVNRGLREFLYVRGEDVMHVWLFDCGAGDRCKSVELITLPIIKDGGAFGGDRDVAATTAQANDYNATHIWSRVSVSASGNPGRVHLKHRFWVGDGVSYAAFDRQIALWDKDVTAAISELGGSRPALGWPIAPERVPHPPRTRLAYSFCHAELYSASGRQLTLVTPLFPFGKIVFPDISGDSAAVATMKLQVEGVQSSLNAQLRRKGRIVSSVNCFFPRWQEELAETRVKFIAETARDRDVKSISWKPN